MVMMVMMMNRGIHRIVLLAIIFLCSCIMLTCDLMQFYCLAQFYIQRWCSILCVLDSHHNNIISMFSMAQLHSSPSLFAPTNTSQKTRLLYEKSFSRNSDLNPLLQISVLTNLGLLSEITEIFMSSYFSIYSTEVIV